MVDVENAGLLGCVLTVDRCRTLQDWFPGIFRKENTGRLIQGIMATQNLEIVVQAEYKISESTRNK